MLAAEVPMRRIAILLLLGFAACRGEGRKPSDEPAASSTTVTKEAPRITASELQELLRDQDFLFLDVREPEEIVDLGTIEGYVNIPIGQLADRLDELPRDKPILTA
jgi:3-mercaptopyruvate sulfurtransferase SseA